MKKTAAVISAVMALSMASYHPVMTTETVSPYRIIYAAEEEKTEDGFIYFKEGTEAVIFEYKGTEKDITVPEKIGDLTVTCIGEGAFHSMPLISVTLPSTIKEIRTRAFFNCQWLTSITIPSDVHTIGREAFADCKNLIEVELNDGLSKILYHAFADTALTEISIPESVTKIQYSFANVNPLKHVSFKGSRSVIPEHAFSDCKYLTEITAPAETEYIYMNAFAGCKNLKTLKILNPDCVMDGTTVISDYLTIYGYENSTAQKYAEENNYKFAVLEGTPVAAESPSPSPSPTPATSPVPSVEPTVIPAEDADMNGDAAITIADYVALIRRLLTANVEYDEAFDINKDGKINIADLVSLRNIFIGTSVCG